MHILILGGTRFVGRHIVEAARGRGHEITLFNRGQSNPDLFPDVTTLRGDRDGELQALRGKRWDAVIDTSGYVPRVVRDSAELLVDAVDRYLFISSISVYADPLPMEANESAPLATVEDETVEEITGETYGALKALCEKVVQEVFGPRALIIRPGLIVGPHDPTDRFTYWPVRVARGGEVLAPGTAAKPVKFIDARDLAQWTVTMLEEEQSGIYHATGPAERLPMGELLAACRAYSHSGATFEWVDEEFLLAQDVQPFVDLPLWVPGEEGVAYGTIDVSRAVAGGLTFRSLEETVADTMAWAETLPDDHQWRAGLSPERERTLLQTWYAAQQ